VAGVLNGPGAHGAAHPEKHDGTGHHIAPAEAVAAALAAGRGAAKEVREAGKYEIQAHITDQGPTDDSGQV